MTPSLFRPLGTLLAVALAGYAAHAAHLTLREDPATHTLSVYRDHVPAPILTQNAKPDFRPYLHPIVSPDGKSVLTEFSPGHHKHQTGIYWGLTRVNGRDYFHNPSDGHWRRIASAILTAHGTAVKWSTVYHLLDASGQPIMAETQTWTMRDLGDRYLLDLEWKGEGLVDLTVARFDYGGLFVRMPWRAGMEGGVVNSNRQRNARATGQRALWVDVGLKLEGRTDEAHIAVFDHPRNAGYPLPWRVDGQMGVGPSRAIAGDWSIAQGKTETVRHQLVVYTGELNDLALTDAWKAYTGQNNDTVLWGLAKAEGLKATFLTGEQAVAKMTVADGFEVKLAAAEPAITQPMAFCWDDRGRLWVAENRDYETRRTGFANHGDSRILILEDTDGDGRFDSRKVFLEGIPFPAAIAVGFDGLWLGAPPNLLFIPDRNHDDRADAEIEIRLTGWGIQDRHETLNSLHWGPDGWLYGCQGYATRSTVGKPADGGRLFKKGEAFPEQIAVKDGQYLDGGVWRYHPTKDRFEVVAHGFSNPWGVDFDDHGQMFITACVIPHLWHVIPGGIYHRQGGKHINPYIYDDIKTIADHRHRSAHGGARIYLADEFPQRYRDRIFMANIHEHAVLSDVLVPKGSGFVGKHGDDTLLANDAAWVGFSIEIGPDGAIYVLDWHDGDICGNSLTAKETGRIYRLAPKGLPGKSGLNLAAQSDLELVGLLHHRNDWFSRRARVLLQQRAAAGRLDPAVPARLRALLTDSDTAAKKLRALWTLHITGHLPAADLLPLLDHPEPYLRGWAIQLLGEDQAIGTAALKKFAALAASDPSPIVRLYLASALQRMPLADRWPIAERLVARREDVADHNIPKVIWSGIEPLVPADPARALALATRSALPQLTRWITRRAVAAGQLEAIASTLTSAGAASTRLALLEGLRDGLAALGRREARAPANWADSTAPLAAVADAKLRELLTQVNQLFGDARAFAAQLAVLQDRSASVERRHEILRAFARDGYAEALPATLALLDEAPLRRDAIRALAAFDDPRVADTLLASYPSLDPADKAEVILTLSGRRSTAQPLLAALRRNTIPKRDVSAFAARQLVRVLGPAFADFWGPVAQPDENKLEDIARYKRLLTDAEFARADVRHGRALFERTCSACHMLYGAGGNVGPDLTGSNRANLDYILTEIVNPSEVMLESYQLVTVTTRDGRTLSGNVAAEDDRQLTLRLIGQDTTLAKAEIVSREKSPVSLMPEGLLKSLSQDEVRDLLAYLRTTSQVPLP
jgi:putative membrane-bound dehydrogenase-like protein